VERQHSEYIRGPLSIQDKKPNHEPRNWDLEILSIWKTSGLEIDRSIPRAFSAHVYPSFHGKTCEAKDCPASRHAMTVPGGNATGRIDQV